MSSQLGKLIREKRLELELGVRELGRRIELSPSMIVRIEYDDPPPKVSLEKLVLLSDALELDSDEVILLAGKTPEDVVPDTLEEVALFRKVKEMSKRQRKKFLSDDS